MPIATSSEKIDLSSEKKTEELADKILTKLKINDVVFLKFSDVLGELHQKFQLLKLLIYLN